MKKLILILMMMLIGITNVSCTKPIEEKVPGFKAGDCVDFKRPPIVERWEDTPYTRKIIMERGIRQYRYAFKTTGFRPRWILGDFSINHLDSVRKKVNCNAEEETVKARFRKQGILRDSE